MTTTTRTEADHLRQVFVPTVIEEGNRGDRAFDIYSQLLRERIVFLGQEVDDQVANLIISQMLFLEAQNSERDIYLYINSPGGVAYAGMAIYDVMQHVEPDVSTICVGMGMSAAAMILSGGAAGKRFALPNARIMIHQGSAGTRGAPSDMEIQLREVMSLTRRMSEIIAHHSGQPLERVAQDIDRDYYMTSAEARDYGIIDDIILPRRGLCAPDALGGGVAGVGGVAEPNSRWRAHEQKPEPHGRAARSDAPRTVQIFGRADRPGPRRHAADPLPRLVTRYQDQPIAARPTVPSV